MGDQSLISESLLQELMSLPDSGTSERRRNLIEIAGYPDWENVNSNFLAFYFDPDGDHGFGHLFVSSLLNLCTESSHYDEELIEEFTAGSCFVDREVSTDNRGRIDILIRPTVTDDEGNEEAGTSAAIIIENKIYAGLHNDLPDYYKSVSAEKKIGVVLCIRTPKERASNFIPITHRSLISEVMRNLDRDTYMAADDRHLMFLKEYIANIDRFERSPEEESRMKDAMTLFHNHKDEIEKLMSQSQKLGRHITDSVNRVMKENGFPPKGSNRNPKSKHYHSTSDSVLPQGLSDDDREQVQKFRIFVNLARMKYQPVFKAYFELHGRKNVQHGGELRKRIQSKVKDSNSVSVGGNASAKGYYHIYCINIPFSLEGYDSLTSALQDQLWNHFFSPDAGYVQTAVRELKGIVGSNG